MEAYGNLERAKPVQKAVISGEDRAFAGKNNGQCIVQDQLRIVNKFEVRKYDRFKQCEPVSRMAMPKHFRQILPPFANIFFDNRPVRIDRIIENNDISRTFSFFNEERGERCC